MAKSLERSMLALCAVALVVSLSWNTRKAEAGEGTSVEYLVVDTHITNDAKGYAAMQAEMNKHGKDGWELLFLQGTGKGDLLVFKR